jgi:hypothetical protein
MIEVCSEFQKQAEAVILSVAGSSLKRSFVREVPSVGVSSLPQQELKVLNSAQSRGMKERGSPSGTTLL